MVEVWDTKDDARAEKRGDVIKRAREIRERAGAARKEAREMRARAQSMLEIVHRQHRRLER